MPRVVGIDPGTVSIDVCGMADGEIYLDRSWPTEQALADPDDFIEFLTRCGPPDLVAGPSGYGLPLIPAAQATDDDLNANAGVGRRTTFPSFSSSWAAPSPPEWQWSEGR